MKLSTQRVAALDDTASRIIPFSSPLTESIVTTRSGDYVSTWKVHGLSFEGLSNEEAYTKMESLNLLVRGLSNGKFAFWVHRIRRYVTDSLDLPEQSFAKNFISRYYEGLSKDGLMATEIYLTVVYRPYPQKKGGLFGNVGRSLNEIKTEGLLAVDVLDNLDRQVTSTLRDYGVTQLKDYTEHGVLYSRQQEFYSYLINGHWWKIPVKQIPLYNYLAVTRHFFGNEIVESRNAYGSEFSAYVDLKDYADFSEPGILNTLFGLGCEYVETHSFSPMNGLNATAALKRQRKQLISSEDSAGSQIEQLDLAIDQVISGNFSLGEYHYTLQVKGDSPEDVKRFRAEAIERLSAAGFLGVPLDLITDNAFAAQLPSNFRFRPREAKLSSRNFTGLCAMHNFATGKRNQNPWGEALTIFRSPALQPVYFNLHDTDLGVDSLGDKALGNTQIIGKSGGGKTVLSLFLLMNLLKYGTQTVFFDKDRGAEIAIRAVGGKYLALERGKATGFSPFKMEPTTANILFWDDLVSFCSGGRDKLTPSQEAQISHAVNAVANLPAPLRGFQTVIQNLPDDDVDGIARRLQKWCAGSQFGWALDCEEDALEFETGRPYGFDYTELLDDPATCPAIMMYLMFRVENIIDGRRFAFFMDEYWKALSVSYFEDFAKNKQKTIRKQNGLGIYMTQSPGDTLSSPIARALIEQTATFIFLPNPTADYEDYVNGFKLTETEFELVRSLQESSRMFVIKQEHKVSLAQLDLSGFKSEIKILSGSTDAVARLDSLRERLGEEPDNWLDAFIRGEK